MSSASNREATSVPWNFPTPGNALAQFFPIVSPGGTTLDSAASDRSESSFGDQSELKDRFYCKSDLPFRDPKSTNEAKRERIKVETLRFRNRRSNVLRR